MKKLLSLFFILILVSGFALAQIEGIEDKIDDLEDGVENLEDFIDNPQGESSEYLEREWNGFLETNFFGKIVLFFNNFFEPLSPVFELLVGVKYSLSWVFVYAILIWLIIFIFISKSLEGIFENPLFSYFLSFILVSLIGFFEIIAKGINYISPFITSVWIAWLGFFIILIIMLLFVNLGKTLKQIILQKKKESLKFRTKMDGEVIHRHANISRKHIESLSS